ncbi:hypothetical protein SAMN05421819_0356 [Bryocella elongata]|uniref:Dolichyl-phosphate-mannose-protein mannosyltransferase n=2 Tax=Bryocella elongata TaxID=863522 RepID=A0A1H5SU93_9BACT|nr:hypothetical protein SAMN05421819_0356 [Bryocella elongata]
MARQLTSGQSFVPYWPPGLPLYLVPFVASPVLIRVSMLAFWILASWGLWRLLRAMDLTALAWVVLLVFGLLPDSILLSVDPLTQLPVAALLLVACSAAVTIVRRRAPCPSLEFLLLGASLGWAALVRPSALILVFVLPVICAVWSRRWLAATASIALALAMVCAWMLHVRSTTGHTLINTANGKNLYLGNNPWTPDYKTWYFGSHAKDGEELDQFPEYAEQVRAVGRETPEKASAEYQHLAAVEIMAHPGTFVLRTLNRIRCFWGFDTFAGAQARGHRWMHLPLSPLTLAAEAMFYLALILPAVYWLARAGSGFWRRPEAILLTATILLYAVPYWLSMSHPTYHYPVLTLVAVLGAMAFAHRERATGSWRGLVAVACLLLVQLEWVWQMSRGVS